jgi:PhnB protein
MTSPKAIGMSPYMIVRGVDEAITFYCKAFGARELFRLNDPSDGRVGHAEIEIGGSRLLLADEYPDFGAISPVTLGGSPVKLHIDVEDADSFVAHAVANGATLQRAVETEFHGHRKGMVDDPYGYSWFIASKVEEVRPSEMQSRWEAGI